MFNEIRRLWIRSVDMWRTCLFSWPFLLNRSSRQDFPRFAFIDNCYSCKPVFDNYLCWLSLTQVNGSSTIVVMFSNVEQIVHLNLKLLSDLEIQLSIEEEFYMVHSNRSVSTTSTLTNASINKAVGGMAQIFLNYAPLFKLYCQFAQNYAPAMTQFDEFFSDEPFQVFLESNKLHWLHFNLFYTCIAVSGLHRGLRSRCALWKSDIYIVFHSPYSTCSSLYVTT